MGIRFYQNYKSQNIYLSDINKDTATTLLKACPIGTNVKNARIHINTGFNGTFAISLGFPADHSAIFSTTQVDLAKLGEHIIWKDYVCSTVQNLTLYVSGTSTQGSLELLIDIDKT
jgi:hypothetical protein